MNRRIFGKKAAGVLAAVGAAMGAKAGAAASETKPVVRQTRVADMTHVKITAINGVGGMCITYAIDARAKTKVMYLGRLPGEKHLSVVKYRVTHPDGREVGRSTVSTADGYFTLDLS